jgi:hypothetical protein
MAEDPLCTHTPGTFAASPLLLAIKGESSSGAPVAHAEAQSLPPANGAASIQYGIDSTTTIVWDEAASARMKKIPAFVRGMVIRAVEQSCRKNGISRVTAEELEKIRARMPTPKMFG